MTLKAYFHSTSGSGVLSTADSAGKVDAARALSIMESHSITALVVPDEQGSPLGVIHLHDILRQGIV